MCHRAFSPSANGLSATDPATLQNIYDFSLILLYRLLFILYAEARNLLPVNDSDFYPENLACIRWFEL